MTRTLAALTAAASLLGPIPAKAIVGGTPLPDASADAIVAVYGESEGFLCSGAVIAPTIVLTSASCVGDPNPGHYAVLGGLNPLADADFSVAVSGVHPHPSYDPIDSVHDVGVVVTASPLPVTPLPWLAANDGSYAPQLSVNLFGFGVTSAAASDAGVRRGGSARIDTVFQGSFVSDFSTGQGGCFGDTGGPAMPADSIAGDVVMGVVSFGDQNCSEYTAFTRTDANADFIAEYAPEAPSDAAAAAAIGALLTCRRRRASR